MSRVSRFVLPLFMALELIIYVILSNHWIEESFNALFLAAFIAFVLVSATDLAARQSRKLSRPFPRDMTRPRHVHRFLDIYLIPAVLVLQLAFYQIIDAFGMKSETTNLVISGLCAVGVGLLARQEVWKLDTKKRASG